MILRHHDIANKYKTNISPAAGDSGIHQSDQRLQLLLETKPQSLTTTPDSFPDLTIRRSRQSPDSSNQKMEDNTEALASFPKTDLTPLPPSKASGVNDDLIPAFVERHDTKRPDIPRPEQTLNIEDLPLEILEAIFGLLIQEGSVNVSVLRRRYDGQHCLPSNKFMHGFPGSLTALDGLIHTSPVLRNVALETLGHRVTFRANSDTFTDFPLAFGPANARHIKKLELQLFFHYKLRDEDSWPAFIDMLEKYIPMLEYLKLWSFHDGNAYTLWNVKADHP